MLPSHYRILEITLVLITAICKFIFMDWLEWRLQYVVVVVVFWTLYVILRRYTQPDVFKEWGFRTDNFRAAFKTLFPIGVLLALTCFVLGWFNDSIIITWHFIPIVMIYPLWGVIQHFLLISLTTGNLKRLQGNSARPHLAVFVSALLFAAVHYPWWWLVLATFILAIIYGYVFLKTPNLYALGLFHGWLGAICFFTLVGRDPYLEALNSIL